MRQRKKIKDTVTTTLITRVSFRFSAQIYFKVATRIAY